MSSAPNRACNVILLSLLFSSCGADNLIISKYSSAGSTPFVIGILALGVLIGLLCYNLFLAITTREPMFAYFSVMMILLSILQTFSTYDRFFFRLTYNRVTLITHVLFITFLIFFENFFQVKQRHRSLSSWNRVSIVVIAGYTVLFLILKALFPRAAGLHAVIDFIRELFVFYTNALFIANIIMAIRWMKREAIMILIAFIPPAVLTSLNAMNIFPFMARFQHFTTVMMQYNQPVGLSFQAILLSLAMGNKYNRVNAERLQSDREREQLKRLDKEKTDFFMNMSHELRTPLTIILGLTKQLEEGRFGDSIQKTRHTFSIIERNGMRLLKQIDAVLRIENPETAADVPAMPADEQLTLYAEEFLSVARQKSLSLVYRGDEYARNAALRIRPDDFDSVVLNLLSNTVKYTPEGGSIVLTAGGSPASGLWVTVQDTGIGIPPEHRENIFRRYKRYGKENVFGTGLGLPVVKAIMDAYGGEVSLAASGNEGSKFTLHFPPSMVENAKDGTFLIHDHSDIRMYTGEFSSEAPGKRGEEISPSDNAPVLLLVEDNQDMCMYISSILSPTYRLLIAYSGIPALEILKHESVDMIISDVMMPEMDGYTFYREFRKRFSRSTIPFMFLTARDSVGEKVQSIENGAVRYITKPFSSRELLASVKSILDRDKDMRKKQIENIRKGIDGLLRQIEDNRYKEDPRRFDIVEVKEKYGLTARELEVLVLMMKGHSDKEIAYQLALSPSTIANHNRRLYRKLGVRSRTEVMSKLMMG